MNNRVEVNSDVRVNLQLAWTCDYPSLKRFVNENLKLVGEWHQPGGNKKALFCLKIFMIAISEGDSHMFCTAGNSCHFT